MENHAKIVHQKLVPDPFLVLVNNPKQPLHAIILLKVRYLERIKQQFDDEKSPKNVKIKNITFKFT